MKSQKILYLGLDTSRFPHEGELVHFPIIQIDPRPFAVVRSAFERLSSYTHILVTSRSAAALFVDYAEKARQFYKEKVYVSVGPATTTRLHEKGIERVLTAEEHTGEGVVTLLETLDLKASHLFFPHSSLARTLIPEFCAQKGIQLTTIDLYDTNPTYAPLPDLTSFDQIVFTSPSTVEAFFARIGKLPSHITCISIGPITAAVLKKYI